MRVSRKSSALALVVLMSALLVLSVSMNISGVKAQTQDSLYVYISSGGTISANQTALNGGSTYNYTGGQTLTLTATPVANFTFLCWEYTSASGSNVSTDNPFVYTISSTESSIQALFIPTVNASLSSVSSQAKTAPFDVLTSIGGTTGPAAGVYSNYTIGSTVNFAAYPSSSYKFLYWLVPAASGGSTIITSSSFAFAVTANACAVQAYFVPTSSSLTLPSASPSSSVSASPSSSVSASPSSSVSASPSPTVSEFSSVIVIGIVSMMGVSIFGAYWYKRSRYSR